jgi:hypothetical protein
MKLLLSTVTPRKMKMVQLDVKIAFLYGNLTEEIYMEPTEIFITPGHENEICLLKKTKYGLKQASRLWGE